MCEGRGGRPGLPVPNSLYGLCERKATSNSNHQNDFCIMMSSDECRFNVLLTVKDKVTRQSPQTTTTKRERERRAESESNRGSAYQTSFTARPNRFKERQDIVPSPPPPPPTHTHTPFRVSVPASAFLKTTQC